MTIIVVEIPYDSNPKAWAVLSKERLIERAGAREKPFAHLGSGKVKMTREQIDILFEKHLEAALEKRARNNAREPIFDVPESPEQALVRYEHAQHVLASGLHTCLFLTIDEAKEFVCTFAGHQFMEARTAVSELLEKRVFSVRVVDSWVLSYLPTS